uniref:Knr4/Smi1-like domain-containing protein n=1 Tax=Trieres chinensis TaxID=1514140 RepID=A0A7S2EFE8_TRICV|mmetsp:Transcript_21373/g.43144  ORF Transcript_21373/g.43144 Transcript_21373/m.43144 type:complete len:227 (+) Transcript_21373:38-718(+)
MTTDQANATAAWQALAEFWSPFAFMLGDGATVEEIDAWQAAQDVTLPSDVRALIGVHSHLQVPAITGGGYPAEVSLSHVSQWVRFDRSEVNTRMDDPEWWPEIFEEAGLPSASMADYVIVGSSPWGADYGIYVMLHPGSSAVYGIASNEPRIDPLGSMVDWVAKLRPKGLPNVQALPAAWEDFDEGSGAGLAERHRFYLGLGHPERLQRWESFEAKFIEIFDSLSS